MRARLTEGYQPDFDIDLRHGQSGERMVAAFIEGFTDGTIEVKNDRQAAQTGNIWIEYECRGRDGVWRDSGIRSTRATYWALVLGGTVIIGIPTDVLRRIVDKALEPALAYMRSQEKDGSNPTHGVRVPLNIFVLWVRMELIRRAEKAA